jgi:hypothetical protein
VSATQARPGRSGRAVLALILGLFALPFLTAFGLNALHWRPATVAMHGTLVEPGPTLPLDALRGADGQALGGAALRGRWLMVLALPSRCDAACLARLDEMRRIRVALYRDMNRVARLVLADPGDPALQAAARAEPDLLVARGAGAWLELSAADGADAAPRLYLVDPLGQLVMRYPARPEPAGVKADLARLLKFSWNG